MAGIPDTSPRRPAGSRRAASAGHDHRAAARIEKGDADWLGKVRAGLADDGYAVVEGVLSAPFLDETRAAMYAVQRAIHRKIGIDRLQRAGEFGVLRLMMKYDPHFFRFLKIPELLAVVDSTVSSTAIMHLQNGFILPPFPPGKTPGVFQHMYHRDFPRELNGYVASVNVFFAIDAFTPENGATLLVPRSHLSSTPPDREKLADRATQATCAAGGMIVFDSTIWHAAGHNVSGRDRLAINHQFTRSWIKQQIDYVRALGAETVGKQARRTQQLLGWYTRVVTSLDEYYQPEEARLYRPGQG